MEAMRQQNINLGFALDDVYQNSMKLYDSFRLEHGLKYPMEFDPNDEKLGDPQ
jgi:hypothetical protein